MLWFIKYVVLWVFYSVLFSKKEEDDYYFYLIDGKLRFKVLCYFSLESEENLYCVFRVGWKSGEKGEIFFGLVG